MMIHPGNVAGADRLRAYYLGNLVGNPLDTTIAARLPDLWRRAGAASEAQTRHVTRGRLYSLSGRTLGHGWQVRPEPKVNVKHSPEPYLDRFIYDTICTPRRRRMADLDGRRRSGVLGSDYPYDMGMMDCVRFVRSLDISEADRAIILGDEAAKILAKKRKKHPRGGLTTMADENFAKIPARAIRSMIADCFVAAGLPGEDAARCAALMTEADLTGADGHGIFRLAQYVRRLKAKGFNARPNITVTRTAPATALVDGDNGMGHLVMTRAANEAIALARDTGVAWVGVRRSNHAGPAGLYAEMPAAHGMVGIYAAVANANHMATWGGTELLLGTNPLAIGVPSGSGPIVLDMATSIVAYGTVKKYALRDLAMPQGWFVNPADRRSHHRSEAVA